LAALLALAGCNTIGGEHQDWNTSFLKGA